MYKRILVTTDGSELSNKAVSHAIQLAKVHGAELVALKVTHVRVEDHWDGQITRDYEKDGERDKRRSAASQTVVDQIKESAAAAGVNAIALTEKSNYIADTVIDVAGKQNCDLIVMASHGRGGLARVLLGSETQHVLTKSTIPVLVLR